MMNKILNTPFFSGNILACFLSKVESRLDIVELVNKNLSDYISCNLNYALTNNDKIMIDNASKNRGYIYMLKFAINSLMINVDMDNIIDKKLIKSMKKNNIGNIQLCIKNISDGYYSAWLLCALHGDEILFDVYHFIIDCSYHNLTESLTSIYDNLKYFIDTYYGKIT